MTGQPHTVRTAAGAHPPPPPSWPTLGDRPPVPVEQFGSDHWSTFAYVETRAVDHHGILDHDRMRCDADRHPILATAGRVNSARGLTSRQKYPTRLRSTAEAPVELADHDDYDCLDDLVAAGLLTVTMPTPEADGGWFVDAAGHAVPDIHPRFVTGLIEQQLAAHAAWALTERGRAVAAALRAHKADGGRSATFTPPIPTP